MCAEFTPGPPLKLEDLLKAAIVIRKIIRDEPLARVFPRQQAPILFKNDEGNLEVIDAEFSLIPSWWNPETTTKKTKNNRPLFATHNARLETIDEKPTFKDSFIHRHCIVPILDFYESSLFGDKFAGHRIKISGKSTLLAAGCYSTWLDKSTGELVYSFTIITSLPNKQIFEAGHDRMPVFLAPDDATKWLDRDSTINPKIFLTENAVNKDLVLEILIDRALKDGWQKNAPGDNEIVDLPKRIV